MQNARAGRAETLSLFFKPSVLWRFRSRRRRPSLRSNFACNLPRNGILRGNMFAHQTFPKCYTLQMARTVDREIKIFFAPKI